VSVCNQAELLAKRSRAQEAKVNLKPKEVA
jgi:hypothetical protein